MSERNEERLFATAIEELLGNRTPPDLTARILARTRGETVPVPGPVPTASMRRVWQRRAFLCGAAAGVLATIGLWSALRTERATPLLRVEVVQGALRANGVEQRAPAVCQLTPRPRDQWRMLASGPTHLDLAELGALRLAADSLLEVQDMTWNKTEFGGGFLAGALTIGVISGAAYWFGDGHSAAAKAGDTLQLRAGQPAQITIDGDQLAALERGRSELEQQLAAARARIDQLETSAQRTLVAAAASRPSQPSAAEAEEKSGPKPARFGYPGFEDALAEVDWDVTGAALKEMVAVMDELLQSLESPDAEPGELPVELLGKLSEENGKLVQMALKLVKHKLPGTGVNGVYTHPLLASNQMHATLQKIGIPLTEAQQAALHKVASHYSGADDQRRLRYPADTPLLQSFVDELELKERFYAEAKGLLTPEQQRALYPQATSSRIGMNMFSSGLALAPLLETTKVQGPADFGSAVANAYGRELGLDAAGQQRLGELTGSWANRLPQAMFEPTREHPGGLATIMLPKERAFTAAREQLALLQQISSSMQLTPEQQQKLRKALRVRVPVVSAKK